MKFPMKLRHNGRGKVLVRLSKSSHKGAHYGLYWRERVDGKPKSRFKQFQHYSDAKRFADDLVKRLAKGQVTGLSPGQTSNAVAAHEVLQRFYERTGRKVSLLEAVEKYCDAAGKLRDHTVGEAVERFVANEGTVRPVDIRQAVEQFLADAGTRARVRAGQLARATDSNMRIRLLRFASMFPNSRVCDLTREHVDNFFRDLGKIKSAFNKNRAVGSAKTRNHYRGDLRAFMRWSMSRDYLPANSRLLDAVALKPEKVQSGDIEFYTAQEFRTLLETAEGPMRVLVAVGGLAGLRTAELLRLDWGDVWRVRGHIEVTAEKAKTRQRRLVKTCAAVNAWLRPFRTFTSGPVWDLNEGKFQKRFTRLCEKAKVERKTNGLRHAFCTYHYAVNANENLTAQQAGHSPAMLHANYRGLATKAEGHRWFAVRPTKVANVIELPTSKTA